jgi:hypothetical protein
MPVEFFYSYFSGADSALVAPGCHDAMDEQKDCQGDGRGFGEKQRISFYHFQNHGEFPPRVNVKVSYPVVWNFCGEVRKMFWQYNGRQYILFLSKSQV